MDSAGYPLKIIAEELPDWLHWEASGGLISGRTNILGQYPVHLLAICGKDTTRQYYMLTVFNRKTTRILCLGNSITNGVGKYNSYRRDLWKILNGGNYNFDFIGSWDKNTWGTDVPDPDFDMDHEGHSGWTTADILHAPVWDSARGNIYIWLKSYTPDIVLVELGTNDVFHCRKLPRIFSDLDTIVKVLRNKNPRVVVLIAQIPPLGKRWASKKLCGNDMTYSQLLLAYNSAIPEFTHRVNLKESPVIAVDQYSGINPEVDMFDDIHPNRKGEMIMGERWFKAIRKYLNRR